MKYFIDKYIKDVDEREKNVNNGFYQAEKNISELESHKKKICELNSKILNMENINLKMGEKICSISTINKKKNKKQDKSICLLKKYIKNKCGKLNINNLQGKINPIINQSHICFTKKEKIYYYKIPQNINLIFLTMVAGGGAGGIGYCGNQYFYGGAGGGAGSCIIKKPIYIDYESELIVKVGCGGKSNVGKNGEDTYIEYSYKNCKKKICVKGGENGHPKLIDICEKKLSTEITGGCGGKKCYPDLSGSCGSDGKLIIGYNFGGVCGCNGNISYPSGPTTKPGDGGCSLYEEGGLGGHNYFASGGLCGNINNPLGEDGVFGSGGGGSIPKYNLDFCSKLSGDGGDGIVIIEFGYNYSENENKIEMKDDCSTNENENENNYIMDKNSCESTDKSNNCGC